MYESYKIEAGDFGVLTVQPTDGDHVFVQEPEAQPLMVNGVPLHVSANLFRDNDWGIRDHTDICLSRRDDYRKDASAAARSKVKEQVLPYVSAWLETKEGKAAVAKARVDSLERFVQYAVSDLEQIDKQRALKETQLKNLREQLKNAKTQVGMEAR